MNLLPKASGSRPRLACELFAGGVVAGRSPEAGLPLASVARVNLPETAIVPGLKPGNIADRVAVIAAVRKSLESVGARTNGRKADLTLVIPDASVRVLLLDFDALPAKLSEALPIVRFRLKKLVPFDTDTAMVTFQIMSTSRSMVRVLAAVIPYDVLTEYESVVREAGFEPGAVLPSTLAALAGLADGEQTSLVVNAYPSGVTTAIVRAGMLLLHRSLDLTEFAPPLPANLPAALFEGSRSGDGVLLPLVDRESSEAEWAQQQPLPEYGRNPYADRISTETPTQDQDAATGLGTPAVGLAGDSRVVQPAFQARENGGLDIYAQDPAAVTRSPYASPTLQEELDAQFHNAVYVAPSALEAVGPPATREALTVSSTSASEPEPPVHTLAPDTQAEEIARAVSVAMAFFEDTLSSAPEVLLSAGPLGAQDLSRILREQGTPGEDLLQVKEMVDPSALAPSATSVEVPRSWLAGITGALRS